jgi:hypothetical protein
LKLLKENIGKTLRDICLGNDILTRTLIAQETRTRINKWDCIKLKSFCTAKDTITKPGTVAHACNPHYSEGRNQEDHGSRPAQANSLQDPISKIPNTKMGWWSGSMCRPCVQAPVPQKKRKKEIIRIKREPTKWEEIFASYSSNN